MTLTFIPGAEDDEEQRLEASDPSFYLLTGKQRRFAREQRRQLQRLQNIAEARGVDLDLPQRGKAHKFLELLRNLDRPRNAAHNAILGVMQNDPDGILANVKQGWTFEESAHFEDMLEAMGVEAGFVRKVAGFGGDVVLDPLNLIPGAMLTKAAKVTRVSKAMGSVMTAMGKNPALRETLVRWSGIPGADEIYQKAIDSIGYARHAELMEPARPILLGIRKLGDELKMKPEELRGTMAKLAEETDLDRVQELVTQVRDQRIDPAELDDLIANVGEIRNPTAVRAVLDMPTPEFQDRMIQLGRDFRTWNDDVAKTLESKGMKVPKLSDSLDSMMETIDRKMTATIIKERRRISQTRGLSVRAAQRGAQMVGDVGRQATPASENMLVTLGIKNPVDEASQEVVKQLGRLKPDPFTSPEETLAALDRIATEMDPDLLMKLKDVIIRDFAKSTSAVRFYDEIVLRLLVGSINDGAVGRKLFEMQDDMVSISAALEKLPRWVHHIVTPEAEGLLLDAFKNRKSFRDNFADPRTQDSLHRAFVKKVELNGRYGREAVVPLSFDEIEDVLRKEGLPSKFAKQGRGIKGAKVDEALRRRTLLDKIKKNPGEVARFFDTDETAIVASVTDQTAKSVGALDYLTDVAAKFGKRIEDVGPERFNEMFSLNEAAGRGLANIDKIVPKLKGVRFDKDIFEEVARRHQFMTRPGTVIKYFDGMQSYWKSYTLFLFPWYFTRNAIGDHMNMMSGGFMDRPTDIIHSVKAAQLQWASMRHNSQSARGISVHLAHQNRNLRGDEVVDLALKNGVLNTGWMGGHINENTRAMAEPMQLGIRSFLPMGNEFVPLRVGKWAGEFTENQRRLTYFIHRLERGDDVRQAAAQTKKYLGDYRDLVMTPLEREAGTRVFPFMRYNRYNIPLQIENLTKAGPRAKMLALLRAQQAFGPEEIDATDLPEYVPEWIRSAAGVPIRRNPETGELDFWLLESWIPSAEINNVLTAQAFGQFATSHLSPFIKAPIETATGVSLFKGDKLPGEMEFLGREMDGRMVNLLRNFRFLNELDKYDPLGMFRVLRRTPDQSVAKRLLQAVALGQSPQTINPAREQLQFDAERREIAARRLSRAQRILEKEEFPE